MPVTALDKLLAHRMPLEFISVAELHSDPSNTRTHDRRNIEELKASLIRFGQRRPIVIDANNVVRAGNGLYLAAAELARERGEDMKVGCVRTQLAGEELTAYAIADNRTAELSRWDYPRLSERFQQFQRQNVPFKGMGWNEEEISALLEAEYRKTQQAQAPAAPKWVAVKMTEGQHSTVRRAIQLRQQLNPGIEEGAALAGICAEYDPDE